MSTKLFGTDGVRGRAGAPPLDQRTVRRLGAALVRALPPSPSLPRLLVGRDTRESGEEIERDLALGARGAGASVLSAGVIPTPAIAFLTRDQGFAAGLVISASHNPFEDNGIKVFSGAGEKFTEALEAQVEAIVADTSWQEPAGAAEPVTCQLASWMIVSTSRSSDSVNFSPRPENTLMPLSSKGLCDAEITSPASKPISRVT